ncbi:MarR family transcriptional regulator [Streptomyces pactum]|uniref:MarR family transcriptional regulator n=1 Tax=Streptomyces pactum TaxID=68249 RepID=A0ABS0NEH9_9ACTN|nr:MarR family transcriptional regulator [Streptomyces pactum]MBH5333607.1 MarR family transcriptional regulator [Streptomyces pactum]
MSSQPPAPDDLIDPLAVVVRGYYHDFSRAAARHGLTTAQARALSAVDRSPLPMRILADRLVCDASNATGLITRLEARGLVERTPSAHDRRVKLVTPTAAGTELIARLRAEMHGVHQALEALTDEERAALATLLHRLGPLMGAP